MLLRVMEGFLAIYKILVRSVVKQPAAPDEGQGKGRSYCTCQGIRL